MKKARKPEPERNLNRKDAKKQRVAIVSDRTKALGSLRKKIESLEAEITRLEQELERDNQGLLDASMKGRALDIRRLSQSVRQGKERIEGLFAELEAVTNEHDEKAKEFDRQLAEIS